MAREARNGRRRPGRSTSARYGTVCLSPRSTSSRIHHTFLDATTWHLPLRDALEHDLRTEERLRERIVLVSGQDFDGEQMQVARAKALARLLEDGSSRKLVDCRPGTGRKDSRLQGAACAVRWTQSCLTFLTSLVHGLEKDLGDRADVYSFHGFAHRLLWTIALPGITRGFDYPLQVSVAYRSQNVARVPELDTHRPGVGSI
jgi:hypothetical protein